MFRLARHLKPLHILELGTSLGFSSAYMAFGQPQSKLTTIEGCPNISAIAAQNFRQLNLQNITLLNGNFDEILPRWIGQNEFPTLIFIDGNHRKEPTIRYFEQCVSKAVKGTCLVFDDIHWSAEMEQAWEHIKYSNSVNLSVDLFFMGLVFINDDLSKEDFQIRF